MRPYKLNSKKISSLISKQLNDMELGVQYN